VCTGIEQSKVCELMTTGYLAQTETPETEPETSLSSIVESIDTSSLGWADYLQAVVILIAAIVIGRIARALTKRLVARTRTDEFLGDLIGRIAGYVIVSFGFVYSLESLDIAVAPILGALGIVGIALAFALQDILENFVAGIILQLRRPFKSGDEILSGDYEGTVLEIDARTVKIRTPDGETIKLPSASVIKNPIVNHHQHGRRRSTVDVGVAYGTDLDVATDAIMSALAGVSGVLKAPAPEVIVNEFGSSSIDLVVRYWHQPSIASQWATRDRATRAISAAFREHTIEIPFPQRVLHSSDPSGSNLGPTTK